MLVAIFANGQKPYDGLYAIRHNKQKLDEFARLLKNWNDTHYVMSYFMVNEEYLKDDYFIHDTIDELVSKVRAEINVLTAQLEKYSEQGYSNAGVNLEYIFKPLKEKRFDISELQGAKAILSKKETDKPILRIYGIRLDKNTFIITGGAIKLVHFMKNHPDTNHELQKIEEVRNWLRENGITTQDDLIYSYGEE